MLQPNPLPETSVFKTISGNIEPYRLVQRVVGDRCQPPPDFTGVLEGPFQTDHTWMLPHCTTSVMLDVARLVLPAGVGVVGDVLAIYDDSGGGSPKVNSREKVDLLSAIVIDYLPLILVIISGPPVKITQTDRDSRNVFGIQKPSYSEPSMN